MKSLYILKTNTLGWDLFAISRDMSACRWVSINKNRVIERKSVTISQGRQIWKSKITAGAIRMTQEETIRGTVTSHLLQRIKEFERWSGDNVDMLFINRVEEPDSEVMLSQLENAIITDDYADPDSYWNADRFS